jgi:[ribosomal protein S18]-alanine N-acetyltransferase
MSEPLVIAPATIADVASIHAIEQQSFPEPWRREFFRSEIGAEGRFNLVVRRGGNVIGYLFAMWIFDEMHVNKIAVIETERRRGVADALMDRCFAFAREHQITTISLEVRRSNEVAQQFYRRLDFAASYIRPRYYPDGEAAVVMIRTV